MTAAMPSEVVPRETVRQTGTSTAQHSAKHYGPAWYSPVQYGTAPVPLTPCIVLVELPLHQRLAAQHCGGSTAQHSTAQHRHVAAE